MKRFFFISTIGAGILSWIFFFFIFLTFLFPSTVIRAIDEYAMPSYSIEFSGLDTSGNALNQNFKFSNIHITYNDMSLLKIKELSLGFSFKPHYIFQPINLNSIAINDGYFFQPFSSDSNSPQSLLFSFDDEISMSFKNFLYQTNNSAIEVNGDLFGQVSRSLSGQLSFLHENKLSTIALDFFEDSYRISLNLHSFNWLSLIPAYNASPFKDLVFQMNALGQFEKDQSSFKGSFESKKIFFKSFSINANKGSFDFQSEKDIGMLKLTEFLHPFVDENYPIQVNFRNRSVGIPRLFLSGEIAESESLRLTNLIVDNLFISFNSLSPKYSGYITDLDLKDLYFEEILNLGGSFSGYGDSINFYLNSESAVLRNYKKNIIPVSIAGMASLTGSELDFIASIKNQIAKIDFSLKFNPKSTNPVSLSFKGNDVSKELIAFSLPEAMKGVSSFVGTNIILGRQNSVYFDYSSPGSESLGKLKAKILTNESEVILEDGSKIVIFQPIIEADLENLYIFSPSGELKNFTYEEAYGLLNLETKNLNLYSQHDMKSVDLKRLLSFREINFNLPDILAEQKSEINLLNFELNNAVSIKTNNFNLPIMNSKKININEGNIFIVDLHEIYGLFPSIFMKEEFSILFSGTNLIKKFDLIFSTNINLAPRDFILDSDYLHIFGNDLFKFNLLIQQNLSPVLKINSDLKNIELNSPFNSLSKNKLERLPTEITISNFSNPSLKLRNRQLDVHIRNFINYDGYISIGNELPERLKNFRQEPGLNIYLYSKFLNENILSYIFSENSESETSQLNKLAFNIDSFKFFNNSFSNLSGLIKLNHSEISGNLFADKLNLKFIKDPTGFMRIEIKDSTIPEIEFINSAKLSSDKALNSRLIVRNSSFGKVKISELDVYLLNNEKKFTANNLKLSSNLMSIKPLAESSVAYFSMDKNKPLYRIRGDFLVKDSNKIPYLRDFADFSYFNGSLNLQWRELSTLSHIEGESKFILKDLVVKDSLSDSIAFNLLGVLNLKNILGKLANLDLSIDEFTSMQLGRVEGDLLFSKSKMRLVSPLYIETNSAKMKWVGQINKNSRNILDDLDLNLDLRITIGESLPWYAAILGGLPAIAGSAVVNEIFEEDINNFTNYQYEILGTISQPKLERIKQEIK